MYLLYICDQKLKNIDIISTFENLFSILYSILKFYLRLFYQITAYDQPKLRTESVNCCKSIRSCTKRCSNNRPNTLYDQYFKYELYNFVHY